MAPTQLEIKYKALQRLMKEESYYIQELKDQQDHIKSLESNEANADPYDLKKQREILQDTERLLPTLYAKIEQFKEDLQQFISNYDGSEDLEIAKKTAVDAEEMLKRKD